MAIVKMLKISLVGFEEDRDDIMKALMKTGALHFSDMELSDRGSGNGNGNKNGNGNENGNGSGNGSGNRSITAEYDSKLTRIKNVVTYLSVYSKAGKKFLASKRQMDFDEFVTIMDHERSLWKTVERVEAVTAELAALRNEENTANGILAALKPWESHALPLELNKTGKTFVKTGMITAGTVAEGFLNEMETAVPESSAEIIGSDKDKVYISVIYHRDSEKETAEVLRAHGFEPFKGFGLKGTAKNNILLIEEKLKRAKLRRDELAAEGSDEGLQKEKLKLEAFFDALQMERDRQAAAEKMIKTGRTFVARGWVPAPLAGKIEKLLAKKWECALEFTNPEEGENYPILLKNNSLVEPFEPVTELYSLPAPGKIDPNPYLAPFFFIFFGIMLSDAGYGIILALVAGVVLLKFKLKGMAGKFARLLLLGGISTFIWGVLFGGWFGNVTEVLSSGRFKIPPLWFNPLDDPMRMLIWSFVFGLLHLFTGMALKAKMLISEKKYLDALFDIGFWYILLVGLCLIAVGGGFATAGKYMAVAGAVLLVLTQGRGKKNIFAKFFGGLLSLYNITGYFSDVLSYSRLLALGLSTGVIAAVINMMGTFFGFSIPGIIFFSVVFVIGTVFNLIINTLGAYVHTSRLQYVEFFGKFYESGGKPYDPFRIKTKYVDFINDREEV